MLRFRVLVAIACLLLSSLGRPLTAQQSAAVTGVITDANGVVISGARIELIGGATTRSTATDAAGRYRFDEIPIGDFRVRVIASGYLPLDRRVSVGASMSVVENIRLEVVRLPGITAVVTPTRTEQQLNEVAGSVSVATRDEFWLRQSLNVGDLLRRLPNVELAGGPRAAGQVTAIRGFYGSQVTTTLNGARMNAQTRGFTGTFFMDPTLLRVAEASRGSSSSLYGTGGMGGVLSFRTVRADQLLAAGRGVGASATGGFADANDNVRGLAQLYGRTDQFDGLAALSRDQWGPIRLGGGTQLTPNDGHATNVLVDAGWQFAPASRLGVTHHSHVEQDFRSVNPQADSTFPFMQMNHNTQQTTTVSLERRGLQGTVYRSRLRTNTDANPDNPFPTADSEEAITTWGGTVQITSSIPSPVGHHTVTYGADLFRDDQYYIYDGQFDSLSPRGQQLAMGLFAQDEISLGDRWFVTPSFRWDRFSNRPEDAGLADTNQVSGSPKLTVGWQATSEIRTYASVGRAFRAPVLYEIYQFASDSTFFANFSPNPDLRSERSLQYEGGASWVRRGIFSARDGLSLRGSMFGTRDTDLIQPMVIGTFQNPLFGPSPIFQYQNVANAKRIGAELMAAYGLAGTDFTANYSVIRVTDRDTKEGLYSPPDKLFAMLTHTFARTGVRVAWAATIVRAQDYDANVDRRRPGYAVHDLLGSWVPASGHVRVDAAVTNLFDRRYSAYKITSSFTNVPEIGRNATLRLTFTW